MTYVPNGVCRDYVNGTCTRGDMCRFRHVGIGEGAVPPGATGTVGAMVGGDAGGGGDAMQFWNMMAGGAAPGMGGMGGGMGGMGGGMGGGGSTNICNDFGESSWLWEPVRRSLGVREHAHAVCVHR